MLLGAHLRRLREAQGVTREDAGWEIRSSESKISRMELGRVGFKERDVADLLTLYGVDDDDERDRLLALARQANTPGWWHRYGDVLPELVPVLPGPRGGRRADPHVRGAVRPRPAADRGVRPRGRPARPRPRPGRRRSTGGSRCGCSGSRCSTAPSPPQLWAVVDEAVLRRPIGGTEVMRAPARGAHRGHQAAQRPAADHPVRRRRPRRRRRRVHHPALPRPGPARRRLHRAADQRPLPRQARRRRPLRRAMERLCVEADPPGRTADTLARSPPRHGGLTVSGYGLRATAAQA